MMTGGHHAREGGGVHVDPRPPFVTARAAEPAQGLAAPAEQEQGADHRHDAKAEQPAAQVVAQPEGGEDQQAEDKAEAGYPPAAAPELTLAR
jgi:hypothetical protein